MKIDSLLSEIVADLRQVGGVSALVLGGSRARGTHTSKSDLTWEFTTTPTGRSIWRP